MADSKFKVKAVITADDRASRSIAKVGLSLRANLNTTLARTRILANRAALSVAKVGFAGMKTGLLAVAGAATVATYATVKLTKSVAAHLDETAKFSRQLKINANDLEAYRYAANISGVETSKLDKNIAFFTKTLGKAKQGGGALVSALKNTDGAFLNQLKSTSDVGAAFEMFIAKLDEIKDPALRVSLAMAGFGKSGLSMITMSEGGAETMKKLKKEFLELSGVIGKDAIGNAEEFDDSMTRVSYAVKAVGREIATKLFPVFIPLFNDLAKWIAKNRDLVSSKVATWIDETIKTVRVAIPVIREIGAGIREMLAGFLGIENLDTKEAFEKIRKSISEINVKSLRDDLRGFSESLKSIVQFMQDNTQVVKDFFAPFRWGAEKLAIGAGMVTRLSEKNPAESGAIDMLGNMLPIPGAALFIKAFRQATSREQEIMNAFDRMPEGATPMHRTFKERVQMSFKEKEQPKTSVDVNVNFKNAPQNAQIDTKTNSNGGANTRTRTNVGRTLAGTGAY